MKKFIISEEEKSRILGMHVEATKRHYGLVNEQDTTPYFNNDGKTYKWMAITDGNTLDKFINFPYERDGSSAIISDASIQNLKSKGIDPSVLTGKPGLGLPEWSKTKQDSPMNPYKQIFGTWRKGLDLIAQYGRLLVPGDMSKIKGEITNPDLQKSYSDDMLTRHINALANNALKQQFPPNTTL